MKVCWYVEHEPDGAGGHRIRRRLFRAAEVERATAAPPPAAPIIKRGAHATATQGALL